MDGYFALKDRNNEPGWADPNGEASKIVVRLNGAVDRKEPLVAIAYVLANLLFDSLVMAGFHRSPWTVISLILAAALISALTYSWNYSIANAIIAEQRKLLTERIQNGMAVMLDSTVYRQLEYVLETDYMLGLRRLLADHPLCVPLMAAYVGRNRDVLSELEGAPERAVRMAIHRKLVADARKVAAEMATVYRNSTVLGVEDD